MKKWQRGVTISIADRDRCNIVLEILGEYPRIHKKIRKKIGDFFYDEFNLNISDATLTRISKSVPKSSNDNILLNYLKKSLIDDLKRFQAPPILIEKCEQALAAESNHQFHSTIIRDNEDEASNAILSLFNIESSQYSVPRSVIGEYFGYRFSSHHADIIRFYINIFRIDGEGIVRFENRYRRHGNKWIVKGCGFAVGNTIYLVGNAVSESNPETGLGLRCFALVPNLHFGWYNGPILSMDNHGNAISARVVLVPVKQHKAYHECEEENRRNTILRMIEEDVKAEYFDRDIQIVNFDGNNPFVDVPCSVEILNLIWNGTLTTLSSYSRRIEQNEVSFYKNIFSLWVRGREFDRITQYPSTFFRMANIADQIVPSGNKTDSASE